VGLETARVSFSVFWGVRVSLCGMSEESSSSSKRVRKAVTRDGYVESDICSEKMIRSYNASFYKEKARRQKAMERENARGDSSLKDVVKEAQPRKRGKKRSSFSSSTSSSSSSSLHSSSGSSSCSSLFISFPAALGGGKVKLKEPTLPDALPVSWAKEDEQFLQMADQLFDQQVHKPVSQTETTICDLTDLSSAIKRGAKECSTPLMKWDLEGAKLVGKLCKVFWDGEDEWFYARILNFDSQSQKHFIYYISDNNAEWIDLVSETVVVAGEIVMARMPRLRASSWPAQVFWASASALPLLRALKGAPKREPSARYIEFFSGEDNNVREYAFLQVRSLCLHTSPDAVFSPSLI
jgi:hypothetical protein